VFPRLRRDECGGCHTKAWFVHLRDELISNLKLPLLLTSQNGRLAPNPLSAKINPLGGRLAQMGERLVRNEEAGGSNPLPSTKN
jgi:hypothetical protein